MPHLPESPFRTSIAPLFIAIVFAWALVVGSSLGWNVYQNDKQAHEMAKREALAIFNKDQSFRMWGTDHGGVYAPVTKDTPPSPYLAHLPERDITTPSGRKLTLLNPAYMVRQLMEYHDRSYGVRGHITGLVLLRPQNAPDEWERQAMLTFKDNRHIEEITDITTIEGSPFIRMMRPMYMAPGCDKCHGHLGFKEGDFRGGVSVSLPLTPYLHRRDDQTWVLSASHGAIWLLGLFGIFTGAGNIQRSFAETRKAEAKVRALNRELENRVEERTQALMEQSQRLHTTIANAADGIIVIDQDGLIDTFNDAAQNMFGYQEHECLGKSITMLMAEPHASIHPEYIQTHMKTGRSNVIGAGREVDARRKDGSVFPMYLAVSKIELKDRILFSGICRDLSQDKAAEHELLNAKALAERANHAKSEFLASMSHELRTPLNGIIGFSQLLSYIPDEPLSENQTSYAGMITDAGQHLLSLINDILDLSRIETEGFSLSIETIDPAAAIDNCLTLIVPVAEKHNVTFRQDAFEGPLPMVFADEMRFKQVLMNLFSNAAKYNVSGGAAVLKAEQRGEHIRFSVTDSGPGIEPKRVSELFEPFNRLGQEAGNIEGTGIGLTITQNLIERMKGDMGVDSTLGEGSTFWFELPISQNAARQHSEVANGFQPDLTAPDGDFRILYVEDNAHNRTLMAELLKPFTNLQYTTAESGEDGITLATDTLPDLILMDIDLPGIDGFETLTLLKQNDRTRHIPVIGISANALPRDVRKGQKADFIDYLTKPLDVRRTQQVIFKTLSKTP